MSKKIIINGTGCALADYLYTGVKFNTPQFIKYRSCKPGDGGLAPGKLVFTEELEKFSRTPYAEIFREISSDKEPDAFNIGGPGLVSLINTAQLLNKEEFEVHFYGGTGDDETARQINQMVLKTPLNIERYCKISKKKTPFTDVLSDITYDSNQGERTFINNIGAAWDYTPDFLGEEFFRADIVCFGGTALVPQIHDNLTALLKRAKQGGCLTVVNTVFDFRNEKKNPDQPWPLVETPDDYRLIDLLIMDCEESLKISGQNTIDEAAGYFISQQIGAFIITNGSRDFCAYSNGDLFEKMDLINLPVSQKVAIDMARNPSSKGDTTGCGDNFAGGIIASLALQLKEKSGSKMKLDEAISWGVASGGFACFYIGGTFLEKEEGEKFKIVKEFQKEYIQQISMKSLNKAQDKLVLFGAGKIGRSFIAQLFSRGGYEVVFIDIFKPVIDELNRRGNYKVVIKDDLDSVITIKNVRGVFSGDVEKVAAEIASASIVAVSVGLSGLKAAIPLIAKGLAHRYESPDSPPLDIIIAENLRNAAEFMNQELKQLLPEGFQLEERVGLIETSIGKMVPIMLKKDMDEDILQVFAEPYNTLILDKKAFINPIPEIEGLAPKENMKAWVDRKLFIHNLGHAATAYIGYKHNPKFVYLHEALSIPEIHSEVRQTMMQSAVILHTKYPEEFTLKALTEHIDDLLNRFQNKALGDTIYRVGCDLMRKLSPDDRLVGAILLASELKLPYEKILHVLICACQFRARDENGNMLPSDLQFVEIYKQGLTEVFKTVCGFDEAFISNFEIQKISK